MTAYAAAVEDQEYGFYSNETRRGAIDDALEPLLEAVQIGHKEPGDYVVRVAVNPVWCKGDDGCEDEDHDGHKEWARYLDSPDYEDVHVEVYWLDPEDDDCEPAWRFTDAIELLREAFPLLVWGHHNPHVLTGSLLPGHGYEREPEGYGWTILVDSDWKGYGLDGPLTTELRSRDANGWFDNGIEGLRTIIEAEGIRLAKEADARAEVARALGGVPQSDWRAAVAEDNAAYMKRERDMLRDALDVPISFEAESAALSEATPQT